MSDLDRVPLYLYELGEDQLREQFARHLNYDRLGYDGRDNLKSQVRQLEAELRGRKNVYQPEELVAVDAGGGYTVLVPAEQLPQPDPEPEDEGFFTAMSRMKRESR